MQIGSRGIKGLGGFIGNAERQSSSAADAGVQGGAAQEPAAAAPEKLVLETLICNDRPMTPHQISERLGELSLREVIISLNALATRNAIEDAEEVGGERAFTPTDIGRLASRFSAIAK